MWLHETLWLDGTGKLWRETEWGRLRYVARVPAVLLRRRAAWDRQHPKATRYPAHLRFWPVKE